MVTFTGCKNSSQTANPLLETWNTPFGVPPFDRIKPVGRIADAEPVATAEQLRLWHWLSGYSATQRPNRLDR